ncbi:MAG: hypothetical protein ACT4TC_10240 [Myxococcaceae bacterium]
MTFDGADYVRLSSVFDQNFLKSWDFGRTPLYPLVLRICIAFLGRLPEAAMLPGVLYGFGGAWLLAATLKAMGLPRAATAALVVLSLCPVAVVYEHALLTEIGSFFYLALLIRLLAWRPANRLFQSGALALALACACAHRPTAMLLVPPILLLVAGQLVLDRKRIGAVRPWGTTAKAVLPALSLLLVGPLIESLAWRSVLRAAQREGIRPRPYDEQQLLYGLSKQAVFPPEDPLVAPVREAYENAIAGSRNGRRLDVGGLTRGLHWPIFMHVITFADEGAHLFGNTIVKHPGRYLRGVGRGLLLYLGARTIDSENSYYVSRIFDGDRITKLDLPESLLTPEMVATFVRPVPDSKLAQALGRLRVPYRLLFVFGAIMTLLGFALGLRYLEAELLAITGLPLAWVVVHALTLMSSDRLTVPAQLVMYVNVVAVPAWCFRWYRSRPTVRAPASVRLSEPERT